VRLSKGVDDDGDRVMLMDDIFQICRMPRKEDVERIFLEGLAVGETKLRWVVWDSFDLFLESVCPDGPWGIQLKIKDLASLLDGEAKEVWKGSGDCERQLDG
jgi:hypothetical protein